MNKIEKINLVILSVLISLVVMAGVGFGFYKRYIPKPIATVNIQKLVEENQAKLIKTFGDGSNITPEQQAQAQVQSITFAKNLSIAVDQLSKTCNCVLVNKAALLSSSSDSPDYTATISQQVNK